MPNTTKKYEAVAILLLVIWVIYYLAVLLKTGFISDDAYNSQVKGMILQQGVSLNDRILSEITGWMKGSGRIMVLTWYMTYGVYYFTQDPVVVKAINIAIILSGILLFYIFSARETGSSGLALLACLILPSFFQFRYWHDPILAFTFLIPMSFALTIGALVLFQKYLDHGRLRYYIIAACLYLMALLMYEISFPFCLLFLLIAYARSHNVIKALKQSFAFTGLGGFLLGISAVFRLYFIKNSNYLQSTYPGAELQTDPGKLISAFEIQTFSSVPLSYFFFNKENLALILYGLDYLFLALFWIGLLALIYKIGTNILSPVPKLASWLACGAILLFMPAALTSLSGHQTELIQMGYGFGYIPVYLQYFGLCTFVVALLAFIATKTKGSGLIVLAIVVSAGITLMAGLNLGLNRAVAFKTNETYKYPRHLLKTALQAGLADEMKDGAFLFRTMRYPSDYTWFYSTITGKKFEACELTDSGANTGDTYKACITKIRSSSTVNDLMPNSVNKGVEVLDLRKQKSWILSYNFEKQSGETGRVILGKVDRIVQNVKSKTLIQVVVSQIRIYDLKQNQVQNFNFENSPINFLKIVANQTLDMTEVEPLDKALLLAGDIDFEWIGNIYGREGTDASNLRWSSGSAILALHNMSDKPKRIELTMELGTPTTPTSQLSVEYSGQTEIVTLEPIPKGYSKILFLAPGQTEVKFTSNAKPIQNGDPRNIVFGVFNFKITKTEVSVTSGH